MNKRSGLDCDLISYSYIGNKSLILTGNISKAKFICEFDLNCISLVDIENGPVICVGENFDQQGLVKSICAIKTDPEKPLVLKIQLV